MENGTGETDLLVAKILMPRLRDQKSRKNEVEEAKGPDLNRRKNSNLQKLVGD